jgi:hypothetical protein
MTGFPQIFQQIEGVNSHGGNRRLGQIRRIQDRSLILYDLFRCVRPGESKDHQKSRKQPDHFKDG